MNFLLAKKKFLVHKRSEGNEETFRTRLRKSLKNMKYSGKFVYNRKKVVHSENTKLLILLHQGNVENFIFLSFRIGESFKGKKFMSQFSQMGESRGSFKIKIFLIKDFLVARERKKGNKIPSHKPFFTII